MASQTFTNNTRAILEFQFPARPRARQVRVTVTASNGGGTGYSRIVEVEAYPPGR